MTTPKLLLPLRVPELGPSLGKLVVGTGRRPAGMSLDACRIQLATRVIEHAGEARQLAAREERSAALGALGREAWLSAWEEAVTGVAGALIERVNHQLDAEAAAVRMPRRLRRRVQLDEVERRALAARLGASGARLIPTLDDLARRAADARDATARERAAVEAWQDALKTAARRLEAAWLALEDAVEAEGREWERVADRIAAWRKPLWPVLVVTGVALAGAVWLGLVFGGYAPAPGWLLELWSTLTFRR